MRVIFKRLYANLDGLKSAPQIFTREIHNALGIIAKALRRSSVSRMREDSKESKRSLKIVFSRRGDRISVDIYSNLIQAFIDAKGLRRGIFPPYFRGTRLYAWARRRQKEGAGVERKRVKTFSVPRGRPKRRGRKFIVRKVRRIKSDATLNRTQRQRARDSSIKRIAFLVAREIYRKGITGTKWNTEALKANQNKIRLELENGMKRIVNNINRGGR